jgi:hypothetical protein
MLCFASQMMDSASSCFSMTGREIFLMMTELPEMEMPTSLPEILFSSNTIRMVSTTAAESMMVPSTIASCGRAS